MISRVRVTWSAMESSLPNVTQPQYKTAGYSEHTTFRIGPQRKAQPFEIRNRQMFINGVEVISSHLERINLDLEKMQPKSDSTPVCPNNQLPQLHLTPSTPAQMGPNGIPSIRIDNPCLLKPQHDIPPTPPPQTNPQPVEFFPQRIG